MNNDLSLLIINIKTFALTKPEDMSGLLLLLALISSQKPRALSESTLFERLRFVSSEHACALNFGAG